MCEVCLYQRLRLPLYDITDPRATDIDDRDDWCDFGTIDSGTVPTALKISFPTESFPKEKKKIKLATFTFPRTPYLVEATTVGFPTSQGPERDAARRRCVSSRRIPGASDPLKRRLFDPQRTRCHPADRHLRFSSHTFPSDVSSSWVPGISWGRAMTLEPRRRATPISMI